MSSFTQSPKARNVHVGLGIFLGLSLSLTAATVNSAPALVGGGENSVAPMKTVFGVSKFLPIKSKGSRFVSQPRGEVKLIEKVAQTVFRNGKMTRISSRDMHIPNKQANAVLKQYKYTFPAACGGNTFTYFEGENFRALGVHGKADANDVIVMDVMAGGGPFTAPRLWGAYDQVLNDRDATMSMVFDTGKSGGFGLVRTSYLAGMVMDLAARKRSEYSLLYSNSVDAAAGCGLVTINRYALAQ